MMAKRSFSQRLVQQLPTTVIRPERDPDYGNMVVAVYWAHLASEELIEQPKLDEEGEPLMEGDQPIMEQVTIEHDPPVYREQRLASFPSYSEAQEHAATVRAMRYS